MRFRISIVVENIIVLLGIAFFWPYILGYRGGWYMAAAVVLLAALGVVAVIRVVRFKRAFEGRRQGSEKGNDS